MINRDVLRGPKGPAIANGLLRLRAALRKEVPRKTVGDCLLLATWNIREFGEAKPKGGAPRSPEALAYIAEIISHFDLVAVQEVRRSTKDLDAVLRLLGSWWKYVVTDVTEGTSGNNERLAFVYDSRVVTFSGLAGEIVLPSAKKESPALQLARTPFVCGFKAGWKRFELCAVHIYYGKSVKNDPRRVREIEQLAALLAKRGRAHQRASEPHTIALGDFNIFNRADVTFAKLTEAGFQIPKALQSIPGSNVKKDKHYDQIAFLEREGVLEARAAGVFDFFQHVYRRTDARRFQTGGVKFDQWRTYQMSDHLPMWVQLEIDAADRYLKRRARK